MDVSTSASSSGSVDVQVLPASTESDRFAFPEAETETGFPGFPVVVVHRRRCNDASVRRRDAVDAVDVAVATADADDGVVSSRRVAPHRSVDPGNTLGARPEKDEDDVMEDLEDGDEAAAHRQAEDTADVGHEPDHRNFLENKTMVVNRLMQGPSLKAPEKVPRRVQTPNLEKNSTPELSFECLSGSYHHALYEFKVHLAESQMNRLKIKTRKEAGMGPYLKN